MSRTFEDSIAIREKVPLLLGLVGPSGTGKTYSALRLATGIQRVFGGEIFVIDTEAKRAKHYADSFKFRHVPFAPPFGPLDYLAALQHCAAKGASVIVVDSMSHEHEGQGGVLEMHEDELDRIAGQDFNKRKTCNFLAWAKPKQQRRQLINGILQMQTNFIFCFRAKEKMKIVRGQEPEQLGWMPIAGEEFVFEMTAKCCLLPGADGVPSWQSPYPGEQAMMKLPQQFRGVLDDNKQLSEEAGEKLARWAAGIPSKPVDVPGLVSRFKTCADKETYDALGVEGRSIWSRINKDDKAALKAASEEAGERLTAPKPNLDEARALGAKLGYTDADWKSVLDGKLLEGLDATALAVATNRLKELVADQAAGDAEEL